jgi:RNA polymerase sigma-70 factor (ECF subfamily)
MSPTPPTRWSLIGHVRGDGVEAARAMEDLCAAYRPVVLAQLRRLAGPAEAEDLAQSFFVRFLERRLPGLADPRRGSFRAFLRTAVHNHHRQALRDAHAGKRTPPLPAGDADALADIAADAPGPDDAFDRDWARHVLARARARLQEETARAGKGELFAALAPYLGESPEVDVYAALGARFAMPRNTVAVAVRRLRERLRALVRRELADTLAAGADVDAEFEWFRQALRGD